MASSIFSLQIKLSGYKHESCHLNSRKPVQKRNLQTQSFTQQSVALKSTSCEWSNNHKMIKGLGFPCSNYFNTGILFATSFSHFVINTAVHAGYRQYYNNTIQQIYTCNPVSSLGCHHNIQSNLENHFVQKCI